ncbi:MAG TPA: hypothetical protein VMU30_06535, partial [Bacteroidota bacterium]|nr:hypothetical protein [Bacteroidota bacterium]
CAYLTNGEDIPNYDCGTSARETAKQRKEEAYAVMRALHGEAYFLNIPVSAFSAEDTLPSEVKKYFFNLDTVIASVQPDIILLHSDYIYSNATSSRLSVTDKNVRLALERLKSTNRWHDVKIFVQSDNAAKGERIRTDETNTILHRSYTEIAEDIRASYKSLKALFPVWKKYAQSRYISIEPHESSKQKLSSMAFPVVPTGVQKIAATIAEIAQQKKTLPFNSELIRLQNVISQIDYSIYQDQNKLSLSQKRLLLYWKNTMEDYRCILHGVHIPFVVKNDKVTSSQVFFIEIGSLGSWMKKGKTQVLFPGVLQKEWIVDTRQDYSYPLIPDTSWVVVSPKVFPRTSTENDEGYSALQVRNKFSFMAVHEESQSINNFVYQRDVPLISVPPQTIEVLNPFVFANQDSSIVARIQNNLYNAMDGEIKAEDSLVDIYPHHIYLHPKSSSIDTLALTWKGICHEGAYEVVLKSKKDRPIGKFVYQGMEIKRGSIRPVGIISAIDRSPLLTALHRIGYPCIVLDSIHQREIEHVSAIILDEQSSNKFGADPRSKKLLRDWILAGGKFIVLPQFNLPAFLMPDDSVTFHYQHPILSSNDFDADTAQEIFTNPNIVKMTKWQNAESVIAFGDLNVKRGLSVTVPVQSQATKMPLVVIRRYGQGAIIYSAFDFHPQLLTVQTEAYKFLANILN